MASVDDIRVTVAWRDHHKRQKLQRRLGADGVLALMDLWLWAGANRTDGELTRMDSDDIEIAAQWRGDAGAFVAALVDLRLLDVGKAGAMRLHDWAEHQRWASGANLRSEASRKAAETRWSKYAGNAPASVPHSEGIGSAMPVSLRYVSDVSEEKKLPPENAPAAFSASPVAPDLPADPPKRGRPKKVAEPMPFTIAQAMDAIRHGVLVDPFPKEPKYATRLTALVRQYPSLATWRKVADKLAEGLDGWGGGYRGDKPDLGTLLTRFGAWVQQAEAMAPAMRNDAPPPDPNGGLPFDPEWIANGKPWRLGPDGKTLV